MAKLIKIKNKGRKFGADPEYIGLIDGKKRYLFTEEQMAAAEIRAAQNNEDFPKPYFWHKWLGK